MEIEEIEGKINKNEFAKKMVREFLKNSNARTLQDIYYQEICDYLTKEGEKISKRLEDFLTKKDEQAIKIKL